MLHPPDFPVIRPWSDKRAGPGSDLAATPETLPPDSVAYRLVMGALTKAATGR